MGSVTQLWLRFICRSALVTSADIYKLFCVMISSEKIYGITCSLINLIYLISRLVVLNYSLCFIISLMWIISTKNAINSQLKVKSRAAQKLLSFAQYRLGPVSDIPLHCVKTPV